MTDEAKLPLALQSGGPFAMVACPCCGYATITARGLYDVCPVCFWEDDGQDNDDADEERGRPNPVSLREGRANFLRFGASVEHDRGKVRPPRPEELPLRRFDADGHERSAKAAATTCAVDAACGSQVHDIAGGPDPTTRTR